MNNMLVLSGARLLLVLLYLLALGVYASRRLLSWLKSSMNDPRQTL
jgi:hypothetical protein